MWRPTDITKSQDSDDPEFNDHNTVLQSLHKWDKLAGEAPTSKLGKDKEGHHIKIGKGKTAVVDSIHHTGRTTVSVYHKGERVHQADYPHPDRAAFDLYTNHIERPKVAKSMKSNIALIKKLNDMRAYELRQANLYRIAA